MHDTILEAIINKYEPQKSASRVPAARIAVPFVFASYKVVVSGF